MKSANLEKRFKHWVTPKIFDGKPTKYSWIVRHKQGFKLGKFTDIGAFTFINAKYGVEIGDDVQIGSHCSIYSESTIDGKQGKVIFGKNSKIGSHCVVMPGVIIGENAMVGAFSFINKDIPAGCLAFGVPVKVVRNIPK